MPLACPECLQGLGVRRDGAASGEITSRRCDVRPTRACEQRSEPLAGTIEADRPGFSTSPQTVPAGRLQIEGGYQFTADRGTDKCGDEHDFG